MVAELCDHLCYSISVFDDTENFVFVPGATIYSTIYGQKILFGLVNQISRKNVKVVHRADRASVTRLYRLCGQIFHW